MKKNNLTEIATSYLYKDILKSDTIRKTCSYWKLLRALAFQIGNEVNFHELAQTIGNIDTATVEKYIDLLEKTFYHFQIAGIEQKFKKWN